MRFSSAGRQRRGESGFARSEARAIVHDESACACQTNQIKSDHKCVACFAAYWFLRSVGLTP